MSAVFVSGFDFDTPESTVESHFSTIAPVKGVRFVGKGNAVVTYVLRLPEGCNIVGFSYCIFRWAAPAFTSQHGLFCLRIEQIGYWCFNPIFLWLQGIVKGRGPCGE